MDRRAFLAGALGVSVTAISGCITIGEDPNEHLAWSTSLDADPDPMDSRGISYDNGTVAAVTDNRLFGIDDSGAVTWEALEHPTGVLGVGGGFLGVDWPGYHPRNEVNEAVLKRVAPDGRIPWKSGPYRLVDLAIGSDRLFVVHERPSGMALSACSLADGGVRWTTALDHSPTAIRVSPDYAIAFGNRVVAYDRTTGEQVWRGESFERSFPPAVDGNRAYLTSDDPPYRVLVLDVAEGHEVNRYEVGSHLRPTGPLLVRDGVGVGTGYRNDESPFFGVTPDTGAVRWSKTPEDEIEIPDSPRSAGAVVDGTLFLFNFKYVLRAIDLNDGSVRWSFDAEQNYPVVTAGRERVYVLAGGTVYALDPSVETGPSP